MARREKETETMFLFLFLLVTLACLDLRVQEWSLRVSNGETGEGD